MIALRRTIERGIGHPVLGPLFLILLALLMAFTVVHGAHDQMHEAGGEIIVCVAIILTAILALVLPGPPVLRAAAALTARPPPLPIAVAALPQRRLFRGAPVPLRL